MFLSFGFGFGEVFLDHLKTGLRFHLFAFERRRIHARHVLQRVTGFFHPLFSLFSAFLFALDVTNNPAKVGGVAFNRGFNRAAFRLELGHADLCLTNAR